MLLHDLFGRRIYLTDAGWAHIIGAHPYMVNLQAEIGETLQHPDEIRRSASDPERARLYYKWHSGAIIGDKWICVVVKVLPGEAFVQTAYATNKIKRGELLWPI